MEWSTRQRISRPTAQTPRAMKYQVSLSVNWNARSAAAALHAFRRVAERAAGDVSAGGGDLQNDRAERQRHQREIMAGDAEARTGIGDQDGQRHGGNHGDRQCPERRDVEVVPQQCGAVGADAHEAAMTERYQPETAHHGPGRIGERPDQHHDHQVHRIRRVIHERQRDQHVPTSHGSARLIRRRTRS